MLNRIQLLPHWCISNKYPSIYDTDSKTVIEQTSRVYGKIQELIEDYNKFVDETNTIIEQFINNTNADQECFQNKITKIVHDYIAMLDEKIKQQDRIIEDSVLYIKNNIIEVANNVMREAVEQGTIIITSNYDEENKKLNLIITNVNQGGID